MWSTAGWFCAHVVKLMQENPANIRQVYLATLGEVCPLDLALSLLLCSFTPEQHSGLGKGPAMTL